MLKSHDRFVGSVIWLCAQTFFEVDLTDYKLGSFTLTVKQTSFYFLYTVESRFKVFPQLVFIFWSPVQSPIYAMHKLPRFRVFPAFSGWKFSPYMKSVPWFSVYAKPEGHKLPTSGLRKLLFAQGQLPRRRLENNTRGCSLTLSNWREGATPLRGCVNTCALRIVCSICLQIRV
jgi:hypothetical protein